MGDSWRSRPAVRLSLDPFQQTTQFLLLYLSLLVVVSLVFYVHLWVSIVINRFKGRWKPFNDVILYVFSFCSTIVK